MLITAVTDLKEFQRFVSRKRLFCLAKGLCSKRWNYLRSVTAVTNL